MADAPSSNFLFFFHFLETSGGLRDTKNDEYFFMTVRKCIVFFEFACFLIGYLFLAFQKAKFWWCCYLVEEILLDSIGEIFLFQRWKFWESVKCFSGSCSATSSRWHLLPASIY